MIDERAFEVSIPQPGKDIFFQLEDQTRAELFDYETPMRFVVSQSDSSTLECEVGVVDVGQCKTNRPYPNIFEFCRRRSHRSAHFATVLIVPTGVGAEVGGHAGDATPVAQLFGQVSDQLITHPNVVNAADLNEMSDNTLYVEGSLLTRLLMGTVGLMPVNGNRILTIIENHPDEIFVHGAINAVNAARSSAGIDVGKVVVTDSALRMDTSSADSGRAMGSITGFDQLLRAVEAHREDFDAIALATIVRIDGEDYRRYFTCGGEMVNPYGGVEALLTHGIAGFHGLPTAHAPMYEDLESWETQFGIMDPRMAAEGISMPSLFSVLKGLHRSPRVLSDPEAMRDSGVITASDIGCLVIPDGCLGLPTWAAQAQGIPIVVVKGNPSLMKNDLARALQRYEHLHFVENYVEAAGLVSALRAGIAVDSLHRNERLSVKIERFP